MSCRVLFSTISSTGGAFDSVSLPAPVEGMEATNSTWGQTQQLVNGFQVVTGSAYGARQYNLSWTNLTGDDVTNWAQVFQTSTKAPIWFVSPFAAKRNILPPLIATPSLLVETASPLTLTDKGEQVASVDPTSVFGGVVFTKASSSDPLEWRLFGEQGTTFYLRASANRGVLFASANGHTPVDLGVVKEFSHTFERSLDEVVVSVKNPGSMANFDWATGVILEGSLEKTLASCPGFGSFALRVVPGSAVLTPVNAARDRWAASVSLVEVLPWE